MYRFIVGALSAALFWLLCWIYGKIRDAINDSQERKRMWDNPEVDDTKDNIKFAEMENQDEIRWIPMSEEPVGATPPLQQEEEMPGDPDDKFGIKSYLLCFCSPERYVKDYDFKLLEQTNKICTQLTEKKMM